MRFASVLVCAPLALAAALGACHAPPLPGRAAAPPSPSRLADPEPGSVAGAAASVDAALRKAWKDHGLTPATRVDDARFLRRAYLDVLGTVPPPEVVESFVRDAQPGKRAALVDQLLASPAYAAYWSSVWEEVLIGWDVRDPIVDRAALRAWLGGEFAANRPWNRVVTQLLTATGVNGRGGPRFEPVAPEADDANVGPEGPGSAAGRVNGAVNWFLRYRDRPQDLAGAASRVFLGVQIQCAQCHDHKTERWKRTEFQSFAACFARTRTAVLDQAKTMGKKRARVEEIGRPLPRFVRNPDLAPFALAVPATLDGRQLGSGADARRAVADWLTASDNPWFAKAIVNRMWGHFLGRGFVDPIDDLRDSNPATLPEVLEGIASDFVRNGDDLKRLIRVITATQAYQLAPAAPGQARGSAADPDAAGRLWSTFHVTPLGPDELLRSILDVTGVEGALAENTQANLDRVRFDLDRRYGLLFDVDEAVEQTDFDGTVAQALTLLNGALVAGGSSSLAGGALDRILSAPDGDAAKVSALYLRALARPPGDAELAYWTRYVTEPHAVEHAPLATVRAARKASPANGNATNAGAGSAAGLGGTGPLVRLELRDLRQQPDPRKQAYEDLLWALLNSSEFSLNH